MTTPTTRKSATTATIYRPILTFAASEVMHSGRGSYANTEEGYLSMLSDANVDEHTARALYRDTHSE